MSTATQTILGDLRCALARIEATLPENEPQHRGTCRHQGAAARAAHALAHLNGWQQLSRIAGIPAAQDAEEELAHAATRALMALELHVRGGAA